MEVREIRHSQLRKSEPSPCTPLQLCLPHQHSAVAWALRASLPLWHIQLSGSPWTRISLHHLSSQPVLLSPFCLPFFFTQSSETDLILYCRKALQCISSPMIVSFPCPMTLRIPSLFKITPAHLSVLLDYVLTRDLTVSTCLLWDYTSLLVGGKDLKLSQEQINGRWH